MRVINTNTEYNVNAGGQDNQQKVFRCGASRMEVMIAGGSTTSYYVQGINLRPFPYVNDVLAFSPAFYFPMQSGSLANLGTVGSASAVIQAGVLSTTNPSDPDFNATIESIVNGYYRFYTASFLSQLTSYTFMGWVRVASISGAWVFYQEQNAAATHIFKLYVDSATGHIGYLCTGASTVNVIPTGQTINVADGNWHYVEISLNGGTLSVFVGDAVPPQTTTAAVAQPTFTDGIGCFAGLVSGGTGWVSNIATMTAINETSYRDRMIVDMTGASNIFPIDSGTLGTTGVFTGSYGKGTSKPLPNCLIVGVHNTSVDYGNIDVKMIKDD